MSVNTNDKFVSLLVMQELRAALNRIATTELAAVEQVEVSERRVAASEHEASALRSNVATLEVRIFPSIDHVLMWRIFIAVSPYPLHPRHNFHSVTPLLFC
jgi:hypothetical protein